MMPKELDFSLEPQLIPIHLQFNYLLRESIPLHQDKMDPLPETENGEIMPPTVLTQGYLDPTLEAPSHVVLNHVNCMDKPIGHQQLSNPQITTSSAGMNMVSITQRLSKNKFLTCMYYKPNATPREPLFKKA